MDQNNSVQVRVSFSALTSGGKNQCVIVTVSPGLFFYLGRQKSEDAYFSFWSKKPYLVSKSRFECQVISFPCRLFVYPVP